MQSQSFKQWIFFSVFQLMILVAMVSAAYIASQHVTQ